MEAKSEDSKPIECLHIKFNEELLASGAVKTLNEAALKPRMLHCPCKKCNPFTL